MNRSVGARLLVATDGSPAATAAVAEAIKLAAALKGSLRFLHAAPALAEALFAENPMEGPSQEEILARDPVLRDAAERAAASGVPADVEVISDSHLNTADLAAAIAGIASGVGASMIVVGSRGRSPKAGALLGSVSHNLIRWATVPIVIVNPAPEESARP